MTLKIPVSIPAYELLNEQKLKNECEFNDKSYVFWNFSIV
jgi:hypothetical protein